MCARERKRERGRECVCKRENEREAGVCVCEDKQIRLDRYGYINVKKEIPRGSMTSTNPDGIPVCCPKLSRKKLAYLK